MFWGVDVLGEDVAPGCGDDGEEDPEELGGDVGCGGGGEGAVAPEGVGDDGEPEEFVEDFEKDDGEEF